MIGLCGYNFCLDMNSLDPMPTNVSNIEYTRVSNAIFDHVYITNNIVYDYTTIIPEWDYDTIISADFNNSLQGGNIDILLSQIYSLKLKRRESGDFDWITIEEKIINDYEDLQFSTFDKYCANNKQYQYAIVPVLKGGEEGEYSINTVDSKFNGVFIADKDKIVKLYNGVIYSGTTDVMSVGTLQPINSKYPIVIFNTAIDYKTGSISCTICGTDFERTRVINREDIVKETNDLLAFLKNGKSKILKDWNGNCWLVMFVSSPVITYNSNYGNGICDLSSSWVEQGKYNNQTDLYKNNLIDVLK